MSKLQIAIFEALDSGKWLGSGEIAKLAHFPAPSVRVTLTSMLRDGLVIKKDDPDRPRCALYKKSDVPAGFGISQNLANFHRLVSTVRGACDRTSA